MTDLYFQLLDDDLPDLKKILEYYKKDQIYVAPFYDIRPFNDAIWYESPLNSEYYHSLILKLKPIDYLLEFYSQTGEDWCLEKAISWFYLWYEEYIEGNIPNSENNLDIEAYRLIVICNLFSVANSLDLCLLEDVFDTVINEHIEKINENYEEKSLTGITQDLALYYVALIKEKYNEENKKDMKLQALDRLKVQLDYFITNDSSFLGQAVLDSYTLYYRLLKLSNLIEDKNYSTYLENKINHLLSFIYAFLEPGGYLPPIGMSPYYKIPEKSFIGCKSPLIKHIVELMNHNLTNLLYTNAFFKTGNYFITINQNVDYSKLIFLAAFHQMKQKQFDDLSFLLYINNLLVFIDNGVVQYQNSHPLKQAVDSNYSHNTICIDETPYSLKDLKGNYCAITNIATTNDVSFCSGINLLNNDVLIKRSMLLIKNKTLLIIDEIIGLKQHTIEVLFNINPLMKLKHKKKSYYGFYNKELQFSMQPVFSTIELKDKYNIGNKKTHKGIYCHDGYHIEGCHSITYKGFGRKALIVTQINILKYNETCKVMANLNKIKLTLGEKEYMIENGNHYPKLYIGNKLIEDVKNENKNTEKVLDIFYKKAKINLHTT